MSKDCSIAIKALYQTLSQVFDMSNAIAKDSPKHHRTEDQYSYTTHP